MSWLCSHPIYEYKGWIFEYHAYLGVWPLKKNLEPRKFAGRTFWKIVEEFLDLPKTEQKKYRIGGGCIPF